MRHISHIYPHKIKRRGARWRHHKYRQDLVQTQRRDNHTQHILSQSEQEARSYDSYEWYTYDYDMDNRRVIEYASHCTELRWDNATGEHETNELERQLQTRLAQIPQFVAPYNPASGSLIEQSLHSLRNILLYAHHDVDVAWDALCRLLGAHGLKEHQELLIDYAAPHVDGWEQSNLHMNRFDPDHPAWPLVRALACTRPDHTSLPMLPPKLAAISLRANHITLEELSALIAARPTLNSLTIETDQPAYIDLIGRCEQLESVHIKWSGCLTQLSTKLDSWRHRPLRALVIERSMRSGSQARQDAHDDRQGMLPLLTNVRSLELIDLPVLLRIDEPQQWLCLEHLSIVRCGLAELSQLQQLPALRSLSHTSNLALEGDLSTMYALPRLHSLHISGSYRNDLTELSGATGLLSLELESHHNLLSLDGLESMKSLQKLAIKGADRLENVTAIGALQGLASLALPIGERSQGSELLCSLTKLEMLDISDTRSPLQQLSQLELPASLKMLTVRGMRQLEAIDVELPNLQELNASSCEQLRDLSGLAGALALEVLYATDCHHLTDIAPLERLGHLEIVDFSGCHGLSSIKALGATEQHPQRKLRWLSLHNCHNIDDISALEQCPQLRYLNATHTKVQDWRPLASVRRLEELYIASYHWRPTPPKGLNSLATLANLRQLTLPAGYWLQALGHHPVLTRIVIYGYVEADDLSGLQGTPSLHSFTSGVHRSIDSSAFSDCPGLRELFLHDGWEIHLSGLQGMELQQLRLSHVDRLPGLDGLELPALAHLQIHGCPSVTSPPWHQLAPHLMTLSLEGCKDLETWPSPQDNRSLRALVLPEHSAMTIFLEQPVALDRKQLQAHYERFHNAPIFNGIPLPSPHSTEE